MIIPEAPTDGTVSFKYDPLGRRIYKSSSSGTSVFAYDGHNLIEETNAAGALVARYAQTENIDEPLAEVRSGMTSYYEADGLGSVTSLTNSAGATAQTYTYDSFGKQTGSSGSLTNPFQYTGRESDAEIGLYYYRARYYDSFAGRFVSEDPIGYAGGSNFYLYVDNAPADFSDPIGLCPPVGRKLCSAILPDGKRRTMVQTLMGEMTGEGVIGQHQYADDQSGPLGQIGAPRGPEISDDTLNLEALLMTQTMLNLGHIGNAGTYTGLPQGRQNTDRALKSPAGSLLCTMLQRAIAAVDVADNWPFIPPLKGWKAVLQGTKPNTFVRSLGNGIRVAGTDFQY